MKIKIDKNHKGSYDFMYDDKIFMEPKTHQEVIDLVRIALTDLDREPEVPEEEE